MDAPRFVWHEPPTAPPATPPPPPPAIEPPPAVEPVSPDRVETRRRGAPSSGSRRLVGLALATSLLSATIASAVTAVAVVPSLTVQPAPTPATSVATASGSGASSAAVQVSTSGTTAATPDPAAAAGGVVTAVEKATPSVVTITTSISSGTGRRAATGTGVGSGVIYTSNGYILTNAHVVEGAQSVTVTLSDGRDLQATVVKSDTDADLAVVKINATGLTAATIASSAELQIGETVIAIGSPLGDYEGSVTTGVLSGVGRTITVADELTGQPRTLSDLLQTDAAINPGNSGGPLLDAAGDVIGLNAASATSAEGLGFAIPIDAATAIMAEAQSVA